MKPDISVLIVSFNTRQRLAECLSSLRAQTGNVRFETIVLDNASRDGSADAVERDFREVRLVRSHVNLGFGNGNNRALAHAQGRYLVLLNSDALLPPDGLAQALAQMDAAPTVGMAGGRLSAPDGGWQPSARRFPTLLDEFLNLSGLAAKYPKSQFFGRFDRTWADPAEAAEVDWVPGAFAIIRRELVERIGLFDPRFFLYYEEVDLCRRIKAAGFSVQYWPNLQISHIGGESSRTVEGVSFTSSGAQLTLWRIRSQLLYYRKWHGLPVAWLVRQLEQNWHRLRALRNCHRDAAKAAESTAMVKLWSQAWRDTQGGDVSPPQPW
ncbi:MAG: glycosyltransferase family 2 protein [Candidatus Methylumidiphilus sp.]